MKIPKMVALRNEGSDAYSVELHILACNPQFHSFYTHCVINGLKFVVWDKDQHLKTQNSGVMVHAEEAYEEDGTLNITPYNCNVLDEEDEFEDGLETPTSD
ncbi:hypothetical protein QQ045_023625 [Rhodiola kirilowii]